MPSNPSEPAKSAEAPNTLDLSKVPLQEPEDGVFEAYSNVVNLNWTLTNVRIRFAELIQIPDDERPNWENQHLILLERAAITIPWYQVKVLRDMLDGIVKNYETINGELKQPKLPNQP